MISIHQSQFIPWLPYFYKILMSDTFVILDDVQYQKNGLQNRNQIKTAQGAQWITLPISVKLGEAINEVKISDTRVYNKIIKTLDQNYRKAAFYSQIKEILYPVFNVKNDNLHFINRKIIDIIWNLLNYKVSIIDSSKLNSIYEKDERIIDIISKIGDNKYLSGKGALSYMDLERYKKAGIEVYILDFKYAEYSQLFKKIGFIPDLSILDILFNDLSNVVNYLKSNGSIQRIV